MVSILVAVLVVLIVIAAVIFWPKPEQFVTNDDKRAAIAGAFAKSPTYTNYRRIMGAESNIVDFERARSIAVNSRGPLTAETLANAGM